MKADACSFQALLVAVTARQWFNDMLGPLGYQFRLNSFCGYNTHSEYCSDARMRHTIVDVYHHNFLELIRQGTRLYTGGEVTSMT
ncbi:hypothetical_protein (plasmid) [Leishmania braziliensis MHOM/BR/75/M2904]|uniref:Hypothetical_protein n=1 Tax=Leishmania braziliensis MHOM/BR/75/M2904 TaxID=420245 RepID=A0A3P3YYE7_LEIBR|nr:unnamed protein product [Leishmania braziliensis]CAJ2467393.1 unnamed protein product [Leishmania braziliensis]SYZ62967.1 hypothetical_protein [Leishmania braziliensis MHOM/BR/75/M2904]